MTANQTATESEPPFGHYAPGRWPAALMRLARRCPDNWVGLRAALVLRRLALLRLEPPVDVEVEAIRLRAWPHDNVAERRFMFTPRRFDPEERSLIRRELPADGVFVDIGANVGLYALTAAGVLGAGGTVLALEPNPDVFARLACNLRLNSATGSVRPRLLALPLAVGDRTASVTLYVNPRNLGASSLQRRAGDRGAVTVECAPLLDVLQAHEIRRIDILKIDIEGAEPQALLPFLNQAPDSLLPRSMIIEMNEGSQGAALAAALARRGYRHPRGTRMNLIYQRGHR